MLHHSGFYTQECSQKIYQKFLNFAVFCIFDRQKIVSYILFLHHWKERTFLVRIGQVRSKSLGGGISIFSFEVGALKNRFFALLQTLHYNKHTVHFWIAGPLFSAFSAFFTPSSTKKVCITFYCKLGKIAELFVSVTTLTEFQTQKTSRLDPFCRQNFFAFYFCFSLLYLK